MGQGTYVMLALGTTQIPERPAGGGEDDWWGWVDYLDSGGDPLRSAYETKQPYLAIPIAVSDGFLAKRWQVADLSDQVVPLVVLEERFADAIGSALARWRQYQQVVAALDRTLPDPELLIIGDYD